MVLSGVDWCQEFPGSEAIDDLADPFRTNFRNFLAAIHKAGASTIIAATFRPRERAYLMHFCWEIAHKVRKPQGVPSFPGVAIDWDHGDDDASVKAAEAMVKGYKLKVAPALSSQHTLGLAVDLNITWQDNLSVLKMDKTSTIISSIPKTGMNTELWGVGLSYGVEKRASDPPHWSSNGD